MTALKITVDNQQNALMLIKILRSMSFVKEIDTDMPIEETENQIDFQKTAQNQFLSGYSDSDSIYDNY